jgi:hypothetical protein
VIACFVKEYQERHSQILLDGDAAG